MTPILKYLNTGIVFQEIPNQVTLSINLTHCPCKCPGCHSSYLWEDIGEPLDTDALDALIHHNEGTITCVCFMGGDRFPHLVASLADYLHHQYPLLMVGWYSGRQYPPPQVDLTVFDYVKLGPYIAHLGPLNNPTTNQRLYKKDEHGEFVDITNLFWKNSKKND